AQIQCEIDAECPKTPKLSCAVPTGWTPGAGMPLPDTLGAPAGESAAAAEGEKKQGVVKMCVDESGRAPLVDLAPHLTRGRRIIEEVGCFGCHPIEGYDGLPKVGPDLRHVKDKLDPAWMSAWIRFPKGLRKATRMPNFFPEQPESAAEKKRVAEEYPKSALPYPPDPEKPETWPVERQIAAVISFLFDSSAPYEAKVAKVPATGNAERG